MPVTATAAASSHRNASVLLHKRRQIICSLSSAARLSLVVYALASYPAYAAGSVAISASTCSTRNSHQACSTLSTPPCCAATACACAEAQSTGWPASSSSSAAPMLRRHGRAISRSEIGDSGGGASSCTAGSTCVGATLAPAWGEPGIGKPPISGDEK